MMATGRDNLFEMVEVKKAVKKIKAINPGVSQPVTTVTLKLARVALDLTPTLPRPSLGRLSSSLERCSCSRRSA